MTNLSTKTATPLFHYWDEFTLKYGRQGKSEYTIRNAKSALIFISRHLNINTIEECNNHLTLEDKLYEAKGKYNWKGTTFNTYLKNIKTYFIWLEKNDYIQDNKLKKIGRCKERYEEQHVLFENDIKLIVGQLHTRRQTKFERVRNVFFIDMLRLTGARPCELLSMKVGDVRAQKGTFQVLINGRKQKGRARYYNMPSWARDSYIAYRDYRALLQDRKDEESLFLSSSKKTGWTQKGMRNLFRRLSEELGLRVTAYAFRRFIATQLNDKGMLIDKIQDYLGHTRASTTKCYIARTGRLTQDGVDVLGDMFNN